jgi:hypothetical protein
MEGTLRLCSGLQMFVHTEPGTDDQARRAQQLGLTVALFPGILQPALRARLNADVTATVIHTEQLLYLTYLTMVAATEDDREVNSTTVSELLLRINDVLAEDGSGADHVLSTLLRRSSALTQENSQLAMGRYYDILVTRARSSPDTRVDFDQAISESTGLTVEQYLWIIATYSAYFIRIQSPSDLQRIQFDRVIQSINSLPEVGQMGASAMALVGAEPEWYRQEFRRRHIPQDAAHMNYAPFYERPFMQLRSGAVIPISPSLALYRLSLGLHWTLFTYYQGLGDRWVEAYRRRVGDLFQAYISDAVLTSAAGNSDTTVVLEADIWRQNASTPCPDIVIAEGSTWIVVEVTVASITMDTVVRGDVAGLRRELRQKFQRKLRQPIGGLKAILRGASAHPQLDVGGVREVYPLLVTLQPLHFPRLQDELDAVANQATTVQHPGGGTVAVHQLRVLSAEEIEMVTPLLRSGGSLVAILQTKFADDPHHVESLKNGLIFGGVLEGRENVWVDGLLRAVQEATKDGGSPSAE